MENRRANRCNDDRFTGEFQTAAARGSVEARQVIDESPAGGCATIIENWRQLPDGQIEFSVRRLPVAD